MLNDVQIYVPAGSKHKGYYKKIKKRLVDPEDMEIKKEARVILQSINNAESISELADLIYKNRHLFKDKNTGLPINEVQMFVSRADYVKKKIKEESKVMSLDMIDAEWTKFFINWTVKHPYPKVIRSKRSSAVAKSYILVLRVRRRC